MTKRRDEKMTQSSLFTPGPPLQAEQLEIISRLPTNSQWEEASQIVVPSYQPDRAIREAVLAGQDEWQHINEVLVYPASNQLLVYLGSKQKPLPVEEALKTIGQFSASTVLTARIVLAIWQQRRHEQRLSKNGSAAMRLDEILAMRGIKKRTISAYPDSNQDLTYTIGYRPEDKQAILADLAILQQCIVRGECTIIVQGKWQSFSVDDEYLRSSIVYRNTRRGREIAGIFVSAGDWINLYEDHSSIFLAAVEQKVFHLNPHDEQHELRLALYLTERWREQARQQHYDEPISMQELLEASVIPIDKKHAYRFIPRIEDALHQLSVKGILGAEAQCLNPADRTRPRWTKEWLASRWVLLPPENVRDHYRVTTITPVPALPAPEARSTTRKKITRSLSGETSAQGSHPKDISSP